MTSDTDQILGHVTAAIDPANMDLGEAVEFLRALEDEIVSYREALEADIRAHMEEIGAEE